MEEQLLSSLRSDPLGWFKDITASVKAVTSNDNYHATFAANRNSNEWTTIGNDVFPIPTTFTKASALGEKKVDFSSGVYATKSVLFEEGDTYSLITWNRLLYLHQYLLGHSLLMRLDGDFPKIDFTKAESNYYHALLGWIFVKNGMTTKSLSVWTSTIGTRLVECIGLCHDKLLKQWNGRKIEIERGGRHSYDRHLPLVLSMTNITSIRIALNVMNETLDNLGAAVFNHDSMSLEGDKMLTEIKKVFVEYYAKLNEQGIKVITNYKSNETKPEDITVEESTKNHMASSLFSFISSMKRGYTQEDIKDSVGITRDQDLLGKVFSTKNDMYKEGTLIKLSSMGDMDEVNPVNTWSTRRSFGEDVASNGRDLIKWSGRDSKDSTFAFAVRRSLTTRRFTTFVESFNDVLHLMVFVPPQDPMIHRLSNLGGSTQVETNNLVYTIKEKINRKEEIPKPYLYDCLNKGYNILRSSRAISVKEIVDVENNPSVGASKSCNGAYIIKTAVTLDSDHHVSKELMNRFVDDIVTVDKDIYLPSALINEETKKKSIDIFRFPVNLPGLESVSHSIGSKGPMYKTVVKQTEHDINTHFLDAFMLSNNTLTNLPSVESMRFGLDLIGSSKSGLLDWSIKYLVWQFNNTDSKHRSFEVESMNYYHNKELEKEEETIVKHVRDSSAKSRESLERLNEDKDTIVQSLKKYVGIEATLNSLFEDKESSSTQIKQLINSSDESLDKIKSAIEDALGKDEDISSAIVENNVTDAAMKTHRESSLKLATATANMELKKRSVAKQEERLSTMEESLKKSKSLLEDARKSVEAKNSEISGKNYEEIAKASYTSAGIKTDDPKLQADITRNRDSLRRIDNDDLKRKENEQEARQKDAASKEEALTRVKNELEASKRLLNESEDEHKKVLEEAQRLASERESNRESLTKETKERLTQRKSSHVSQLNESVVQRKSNHQSRLTQRLSKSASRASDVESLYNDLVLAVKNLNMNNSGDNKGKINTDVATKKFYDNFVSSHKDDIPLLGKKQVEDINSVTGQSFESVKGKVLEVEDSIVDIDIGGSSLFVDAKSDARQISSQMVKTGGMLILNKLRTNNVDRTTEAKLFAREAEKAYSKFVSKSDDFKITLMYAHRMLTELDEYKDLNNDSYVEELYTFVRSSTYILKNLQNGVSLAKITTGEMCEGVPLVSNKPCDISGPSATNSLRIDKSALKKLVEISYGFKHKELIMATNKLMDDVISMFSNDKLLDALGGKKYDVVRGMLKTNDKYYPAPSSTVEKLKDSVYVSEYFKHFAININLGFIADSNRVISDLRNVREKIIMAYNDIVEDERKKLLEDKDSLLEKIDRRIAYGKELIKEGVKVETQDIKRDVERFADRASKMEQRQKSYTESTSDAVQGLYGYATSFIPGTTK